MRQYDDPVEVRKGMVKGVEAPEQFLWRDRLWQVREVVGHWVETGAWWQSATRVAAGETTAGSADLHADLHADLLAERETWRVVARRGQSTSPGVFDLVFSWTDGNWRLAGCVD